MAVAKRARMKPAGQPVIISPAADPTTGLVTVNIFDGTRQLMKQGTQILLTVRDGAQAQLYRDYVSGPSIALKLPVHNNYVDNYTIVASTDGYRQAGFQPVKIGPNTPQTLDLMMLPNNGDYHFAQARWPDLESRKGAVSQIFQASVNGGDAAALYSQLLENNSDHLACLLNITTAMQQIQLPQGSPLDYFKQFDLAELAPDRIFGYADPKLVDQVKLAAQQGVFDTQPAIDLTLHPGATCSFKQIQFGEANVQLTFHEQKTKKLDGVNCVYVEPDIDYYKDPGAHFLLEVVPNGLTKSVSSPSAVYVLRWIAGRRGGVANFDPLYTIE
jgi:hypothetical protein